MTIANTAPRVDYMGNGATTAFPVPFAFFGGAELQVIRRVVATGEETVLTLGADYTVSGGAGSTGTVTAIIAPLPAVQWTIRRTTERVQQLDFVANDHFPSQGQESQLDRAMAVIQEMNAKIGQTLRLRDTDAGDGLLAPKAVRAGRVLGFNAQGEPEYFETDAIADARPADIMDLVLLRGSFADWTNTTENQNLLAALFERVYQRGSAGWNAGAGTITISSAGVYRLSGAIRCDPLTAPGGGTFSVKVNGVSVCTVDGNPANTSLIPFAWEGALSGGDVVTLIVSSDPLRVFTAANSARFTVERIPESTRVIGADQVVEVYPETYGAVGDGVTNDAPAIQLAISALSATGGVVRFGAKTYRMDSPVTISSATVRLQGAGFTEGPGPGQGTWLTTTQAATVITFSGVTARGSVMRDIALFQAQPTPAVSWTPVASDYFVKVTDCLGGVDFENVFLCNLTNGVKVFNSGRTNFTRIRGQVFGVGIYTDKALDVPKFVDIHFWPFWSADANVMAYSQANALGFVTGRAAGPMFQQCFGLGLFRHFYFFASADGVTTKFFIDQCYTDFCKHAIYCDAAGVNGMVGTLTFQGETYGGSGTPISGASALYITGNDFTAQIGSLRADKCSAAAINLLGLRGRVNIRDFWAKDYNTANAGSPAINLANAGSVADANLVAISTYPILQGTYAGRLVNTGTDGRVLTAETPSATDAGAVGGGVINATPALTGASVRGSFNIPDTTLLISSAPSWTNGGPRPGRRTKFTGNGRVNGAGASTVGGYLDMLTGPWADDTYGADIERANRMLIGSATVQSGDYLLAQVSPYIDHRTVIGMQAVGQMTYFDQKSTLQVISPIGEVAASFGTVTSMQIGKRSYDSVGGGAGMAVGAFVRADAPGQSGWAIYAHGIRDSGAGPLLIAEYNVAQRESGTPEQHPFLLGSSSAAGTLWLRAGGEAALAGMTLYDANFALGIVPSVYAATTKFRKGIIFGALALTGTDGVTGYGVAMQLANRHGIEWVGSDGATKGVITMTAGTTFVGNLTFASGGLEFQASNNNASFRTSANASNANGLWIKGTAAGTAPEIAVMGTDTNIPFVFRSQGTGDFIFVNTNALIQFPNTSAAASVPANFTASRILYIRDGSGTAYAVPCRATGW